MNSRPQGAFVDDAVLDIVITLLTIARAASGYAQSPGGERLAVEIRDAAFVATMKELRSVCESRARVAKGFTSDMAPSCALLAQNADPVPGGGLWALPWLHGDARLAAARDLLAYEHRSLEALERRKAGAATTSSATMRLHEPDAPADILAKLRTLDNQPADAGKSTSL